jgi:redox-sensitive bicupin YhaK (pirin superfamily)
MTVEPGPDQALYGCTLAEEAEPESVLLPGHDVPLGRYTIVRRLLPHRQRRLVGPWCFVDHFGPDGVTGRPGMQVPPHPHTGLQTVTWLVDGLIEHRDSLGSCQTVEPGQLNVMTSGHGIAHAEYTAPEHPPTLHGLQLWIALPDHSRHGPAGFDHHPSLPVARDGDVTITVVAGEYAGTRSPAQVYSPLVGLEIVCDGAGRVELPLEPDFEHSVLTMSGTGSVAGTDLSVGSLLYLGQHRHTVTIDVPGASRFFLLGGAPFDEPLVMWWNFVARTHEEIVAAREDWMSGRRFGAVVGCTADPLPAPTMPTVRLKARTRHGHMLD